MSIRYFLRNAITPVVLSCSFISFHVQSETLLQIYELAKTNDHQYKADQARFNASTEAANIQRAALLPQVSGSASYTDTDEDVSGTTSSDSDIETTSYTVSLSQAIIDFGALNNYRRGKTQASIAEKEWAGNQQDLIIRSAEAYFNVLRALDQLGTSKAEEKALKTQLEQTQQRYEVGLIPLNDVHETRAAYDNAVANTLSADVNLAIEFEDLAIITGKNHSAISPLQESFTATQPEPNDNKAWIDYALANNFDLQVSKLQSKDSYYAAKAANGERLPSLSGELSYTNSDREVDGTLDSDTDTDSTSVSLNLSVPIYLGGQLSAAKRQAAQSYIQSQEELLLAQRNTVQNTRSLFLSVNTDIALIKARQQAIVSNQSALEATQAGYEAGTRDIVDVVDAQRNLFQARRDYFTALYDYIINTLRLKEAAGILSVKDLEALEQSLQS